MRAGYLGHKSRSRSDHFLVQEENKGFDSAHCYLFVVFGGPKIGPVKEKQFEFARIHGGAGEALIGAVFGMESSNHLRDVIPRLPRRHVTGSHLCVYVRVRN